MCFSPYPSSAILLCLLLLPTACRHREEEAPPELEPAGLEIRVRLFSAPRLLFSSGGGVVVRSIGDGRILYSGRAGTLEAGCQGRLVKIGGRALEEAVRIEPPAPRVPEAATMVSADPPAVRGPGGGLPVLLHPAGADFTLSPEQGGGNSRSYRGALELRVVDGALEAVNAVDIEHYLLGVVGAEMPAYFSGEALKAQAVASRTFALYSLRRALQAGRSPVFRAGTGFQVYKGVSAETRSIHKAVASTRGQVLHWEGRLFSSYFHSTCGGRTASASDAIGDTALQPLSGVVCGGCDGSQFSSWRSVLRAEELESLARAYLARTQPGVRMGKLEGVEISERGADGRVLYLRLAHSLGSFEWWAYSFRMAVEARLPGTVLSTSFSLAREEAGAWILKGAGWGHGVGLCQVGARGLVKQGLDYRQVLQHYYQGCELAEAY